MATFYEEVIGPFPGGIENAVIRHTRADWDEKARHGVWAWWLDVIDLGYGDPIPFGSRWSSSHADRKHNLIEYGDVSKFATLRVFELQ